MLDCCCFSSSSLNIRPSNSQDVAYYSLKTATGLLILLELTFKAGVNGAKICVKTEQPPFAPLAQQVLEAALKSA